MQNYKVLFSAPHAFMPSITNRRYPFSVEFREVWHRNELIPDPAVIGWITNTGWSFVLDDSMLECYPALQIVVTPSTGRDHIDEAALRRRNIVFRSLLDDRLKLENIASSAEFTFMMLLNTLRRLPVATQMVQDRLWRRDREDELRGRELQGRKVGIVGLGRIGRRMLRYCEAFGASVLYFDPYVERDDVKRVQTLAELFATADSIIICCSLTDETRGMIGKKEFSGMRQGTTLVNTARGAVINEKALAMFLRARLDVTVALDVLAGEDTGTQYDSPLATLIDQKRVVVTPHIAGSSFESQTKAAEISLDLIIQHFQSSL